MRGKATLQSATLRNLPLREKTLDPMVHGSQESTDDHQSQLPQSRSAILSYYPIWVAHLDLG
jgi:hypothetical protein